MGEAGEGPWESGDIRGDKEGTEGSRDHGDGMVSQNSRCGRPWAVMAQEMDGAVWEDRVNSWGQEWKRLGVEKGTEGWMVPGRRGWRLMER